MDSDRASAPNSLVRATALFCVALLLAAAATWLAWMLLRSVLVAPSPAAAAEAMGLLPEFAFLIKPEPVESWSFVVAVTAGTLLCAAAGHRSLRGGGRSLAWHALPIALAAGLLIAFLWRTPGATLFSDLPSHVTTAVRQHPRTALVLFVLSAAGLLLASGGRRWQTVLLGLLLAVPLVAMSRFVLVSDESWYPATTHYEVFAYPMVQEWLGRGIHLAQKSQYGMYPLFLRPLWYLTGGPNALPVTAVMALLLLASHAAALVFMYVHGRRKMLTTAFGLLGIAYAPLWYQFWPGDPYFAFFPLRLVFPALAMGLTCLPLATTGRLLAACTALAAGPFWNLESGLIGLLLFSVFRLATAAGEGGFRRALRRLPACMAGGIALVTTAIGAYYLLRFGALPQLGGLATMVQSFSQGLAAEPMPFPGAWIAHAVVYALSVFVGVRLLGAQEADTRRSAAALLATAAMGVVWLKYYQGRSHPLPLAWVSFPAFFCLGFLLDAAGARLRPHWHARLARGLGVLVAAGVMAGVIAWASTWRPSHGTLAQVWSKEATATSMTVGIVADRFLQARRAPGDKLLVVAPYAHLVHLKIGQPSPVNTSGMCQMWFRSERQDVIRALEDPQTLMVVLDENPICMANPVPTDPVAAALLQRNFEPAPIDQTCTVVPGTPPRIFLRRGAAAREEAAQAGWQNVALQGRASQSSAYDGAAAARAIDGSTDGNFSAGGVAHTWDDAQPWWQVDLGQSVPVAAVQVWNRMDCCGHRLHHFWVLASERPLPPDARLQDLLRRPDVASSFQRSTPCPSATVPLPHARARYVRVQLDERGFLALAEVKVFAAGEARP